MSAEFYIGLGIVIAFVVNAIVRNGAAQRHARYRMRAKLARWVFEGRLKPVSLSRTRRRGAPKRRAVLRVVRRDDSRPGAA